MHSLAMKLLNLIAVALLVVGLSPCPGFSQFGEGSGQVTEATTAYTTTDATTGFSQTSEAPTDGKSLTEMHDSCIYIYMSHSEQLI